MSTRPDDDDCVVTTKAAFEFTLGSEGEKPKLAAFKWKKKCLSDDDVRAVVFMAHGYAEYLNDNYEDLATFLADNGNAVVIGHDHLGHGRSDGPQAQTVIDFEADYVVPIREHVQYIRGQYPGRPVFIIGHSLGGLMTVLTLICEPDMFKGAVLVAPSFEIAPEQATPMKVGAAKLLGSVLPWLPLGYMDVNDLSRDLEKVRKAAADELRYQGGVKSKFSKATLKAMEKVAAEKAGISTPILVQYGDHDRICKPETTRNFFEDINAEDKELKVYPGAFHNLLMELPETRQATFDDINKWIVERI